MIDRRAVFASMRAALAAAAGGACVLAGVREAAASPPDVSGDFDPRGLTDKLVNRLVFAPQASDYQQARSLGYQGYLEYQLNHTAIDDSALSTRLASFDQLTRTPPQIFAPIIDGNTYNAVAESCAKQVRGAFVMRAVYGRRHLYERMCEFWSDHFSIHPGDGDVRIYKVADDRDVIRANALGTFSTMLRASAGSPAMLQYLNNAESYVGNINENYGREIMELHTISPAVNYTRTDIREVARCFTGWTLNYFDLNDPATRPAAGTFRYDPDAHDTDPKVVLGVGIPGRPAAQGMQDGIDVINLLAAHPSTARFIAGKLVQRFLGENMPASVINTVAGAFSSSGGNIKQTLRALFRPAFVADAPGKLKRPLHAYAHALRALNVELDSDGQDNVLYFLEAAGHLPLNWSPPNGYPDVNAYWTGLLQRWNFGASLPTGEIQGAIPDIAAFFAGATTLDAKIQRISDRLFGSRLPADQASVLRSYLSASPTDLYRQAETVGLAISSNAFQWI